MEAWEQVRDEQGTQWGKGIIFNNGSVKTDSPYADKWNWTALTKINSKWIKYLNVRTETIKLFEENTSMIQIVQETKAKINN